MAAAADPEGALGTHQIGLVACVAFAVGTMIGGGVFALSGLAVDKAGPAAILAYLAAGIVMLLSALSFVVISSRSQPGDSGYAPLGDILGPQWRFLTMWGFYLNAVTAIAFVLVSFGVYLNQYFIPAAGRRVAALLAVAALALLNLGPADLVGKAETYLVGLKVSILLVFVGYGLANIGAARFLPFAPSGPQSILGTTALLFTAYTGFNVVTNMAGSVRNPRRTVPLAIIISIGVSAVIYVGVIVAMLASGQHDFGAAGLGKAASALMGPWGAYLLAFAACISTLSGANANMLGASELMIRLAKQGDVPAVAGRMSKSGHPVLSVLVVASIAIALIAASRGAQFVIALSNVTAIIAMLIVNAGAFKVAREGWSGEGVRLPGGALIPVLGFGAAAGQLPSLGWQSVLVGTLMVLVGYVIYSQRHQTWLAGDVKEMDRHIVELETPLGRALRWREHRGQVKAA